MSTMALPAVPISEKLAERLSTLAKQHGVGLDAEVLACVERGLSEQEQIEAELAEARAFRQSLGNGGMNDELIRSARLEGRS